MLHFLNETERNQLSGNLNPQLSYMRITLPNVELAYYVVDSNSADERKFCNLEKSQIVTHVPENEVLPLFTSGGGGENGYMCAESLSQQRQVSLSSTACPSEASTNPALYNSVSSNVGTVRIHNSRTARSALPGRTDAPLIRFKANLILNAALYPLKREIPFSSKMDGSNLKKILTHLRFIPGQAYSFSSFEVLENNTALTDKSLREQIRLKTIISEAAITSAQCAPMNDFGLPIPDRFPDLGSSTGGLADTLRDLGVAFVRLGGMQNNGQPTDTLAMSLQNDSSNLFFDVSRDLDVCFSSDRTCNPIILYPVFDPSWFIH